MLVLFQIFGCRPSSDKAIIVATIVFFLTTDIVTSPDAAKCLDTITLAVNVVVIISTPTAQNMCVWVYVCL